MQCAVHVLVCNPSLWVHGLCSGWVLMGAAVLEQQKSTGPGQKVLKVTSSECFQAVFVRPLNLDP